MGCAKAHLNVVRLAVEQNLNNILILEDDFEFLEYDSDKVIEAFRELPDSWEMFYLGFNPTTALTDYSPALYRINGAHTTHAYALSRLVLPHILRNGRSPIDEFYRRMHPGHSVFGLKAGLCTQTGSFSDVDKGATDNRQTIIDSNKKYRKELR
jgi:GR25 family glycosyltransferase involved in LPS biosynthesis